MARGVGGGAAAYYDFVLWFVLAVFILYAVACFTPAIYVDDGRSSSDLDFKIGSPVGLFILFYGWPGGNNGIPWSANVFLALGLLVLCAKWFRAAFVLGSIATMLGLTTWWVWGYENLLVGYYLWQASLAVFAVGTGWVSIRLRIARGSKRGETLSIASSAEHKS
jgi:hypothetical protein